jgi:hypothetical protein
MPNIKFSYLYRDGGNYKTFTEVVFANPDNLSLSEIQAIIQSKLIDGTWFYADQWQLPELFPETFDITIDPTWHEFESVTFTPESANIFVPLRDT